MSLEVSYKGQQIAQLTQDGNLTLETAGKYCEGDIELAYSGGGGGSGADLAALEVYIADFLEDPPTVTEGAINAYHRILVS